MTPAQILKEYIHNRGMKYKFFAERVGITYTALYGYIHKNRIPNKFVAMRIENITNGEIKASQLTQEKMPTSEETFESYNCNLRKIHENMQ